MSEDLVGYSDHDTLDCAYKIIHEANAKALQECKGRNIFCSTAYQALIQSSFRGYGDILQSDVEAIRQLREFIDEWENEVTERRH